MCMSHFRLTAILLRDREGGLLTSIQCTALICDRSLLFSYTLLSVVGVHHDEKLHEM